MSDDNFLEPQLAKLEEKPPQGNAWVHEIKFDGYRTLAQIRKGKLSLYTRNGNDWTDKYPTIAKALKSSKLNDVVLDGEVVWVDDDGKTDFQKLQNSLKTGDSDHLSYYIFDLLVYQGKDLRDEPLLKRKELLKKLLSNVKGQTLRFSEHWREDPRDLLNASCQLGLEGIISKQVDAPYEPGRNHNWVKSKCTKMQEFVIGGFSHPKGSRSGFGALLLGTYLPSGEFQYVGRVGTGFTDASIAELSRKFKKLIVDDSPFDLKSPRERDIVWLKPKLVAQVDFTEWTSEGSLRHPSFQGLRDDKGAKDVHPEGRKRATSKATRRKKIKG